MSDPEYDDTGDELEHSQINSTAYSQNIRCGICGAPVRNVPTMYERMNIDWRCARCLRRDKPVLEDHIT